MSSLYEPTLSKDLQKSNGQSIRFGNLKAIDNSVSKHPENNLSPDNEFSSISETIPYESNKPKSLLTALIQESEETEIDLHHIKSQSPPKKHVTLKIPEESDQQKLLKSPKAQKPIISSPTAALKKSMLKPQPQIKYNVPEGAKIPKVGGQRSKKPTLASQWRKQKEKQKQEEQCLKDRIDTYASDWPYSGMHSRSLIYTY